MKLTERFQVWTSGRVEENRSTLYETLAQAEKRRLEINRQYQGQVDAVTVKITFEQVTYENIQTQPN